MRERERECVRKREIERKRGRKRGRDGGVAVSKIRGVRNNAC